MSVVLDLKNVIEEYNNAIAVLEGRVLITGIQMPQVIAHMRNVIQLEIDSENPDMDRIYSYSNAIGKLEKASGL